MRSKQITVLAIMGFVGGATTAVLEGSASAYWERIHPSICSPSSDDQTSAVLSNGMTYVYSNPADADATLHSRSAAFAYFICPIPDHSDLPKASISSISVRVYDGNTSYSAAAKACTVDSSGTGGACGTTPTTSSSGVGYSTLSPGVLALDDNTSDRAYLWIGLPPAEGDNSELVGLYFRDIDG